MHAQRCPMAKLRAASQQGNEASAGSKMASLPPRPPPTKKPPEKPKRGQRNQAVKTQDKQTFIQNVHGDAAPLLPPRPQMYSEEDTWTPVVSRRRIFTTNNLEKCLSHDSLAPSQIIHNTKCAIHGIHRPEPLARLQKSPSNPPSLSKSSSCPRELPKSESYRSGLIKSPSCPRDLPQSSTYPQESPQSPSCTTSICPSVSFITNGERLKNWRRNSLTISHNMKFTGRTSRPESGWNRPLSCGPDVLDFQPRERTMSKSYSGPLSSLGFDGASFEENAKVCKSNNEGRKQSQFRRAWSLFSFSFDEGRKEKAPPQKILRQPTRHVYRRGLSGLPVAAPSTRHVSMVF